MMKFTKKNQQDMLNRLKNGETNINTSIPSIKKDDDTTLGIIYQPPILPIIGINCEDKPEYIDIKDDVQKKLLNEQIMLLADTTDVYENVTDCNSDILNISYYNALNSMVNMIVSNHINELMFMIDQLKYNVNNILNQYGYPIDAKNMNEIIGYSYIGQYKYDIINAVFKIINIPKNERKVTYHNGLPLYLVSKIDYIAQNIWITIQSIVFSSILHYDSYNKIFKEMEYEFYAFMSGFYLSVNNMVINLANPIGIGSFVGGPDITDKE